VDRRALAQENAVNNLRSILQQYNPNDNRTAVDNVRFDLQRALSKLRSLKAQ
jgi:hypothetical protein